MITEFKGKVPNIHSSCFVAASADIIGDLEVGEQSSIWFQAVLRGDILPSVGKQDH